MNDDDDIDLRSWIIEFMTMRKSGFDQFLQILKRKMPFKINMSSSYKEWEGLHYTTKEEVTGFLSKFLRHFMLVFDA